MSVRPLVDTEPPRVSSTGLREALRELANWMRHQGATESLKGKASVSAKVRLMNRATDMSAKDFDHLSDFQRWWSTNWTLDLLPLAERVVKVRDADDPVSGRVTGTFANRSGILSLETIPDEVAFWEERKPLPLLSLLGRDSSWIHRSTGAVVCYSGHFFTVLVCGPQKLVIRLDSMAGQNDLMSMVSPYPLRSR